MSVFFFSLLIILTVNKDDDHRYSMKNTGETVQYIIKFYTISMSIVVPQELPLRQQQKEQCSA